MLKLKPIIHRQKIEIDPQISKKFKYPILFYTRHKDDKEAFFISFVIVDFTIGEIIHIVTYTPENISKVKKLQDMNEFKMTPECNPHSCIQINPGVDFYTFFERGDYFFYVNIKEETIIIYTGKDIQPQSKHAYGYFGATFFKDPCDINSFYLANISKNEKNNNFLNYFKAKLDLSSVENIVSYPTGRSPVPPHATRKFNEYLLNSEFYDVKYTQLKTGKTFQDTFLLVKFSYENLYREYCKLKGCHFSVSEFDNKNEITRTNLKLDKDFENFCDQRGNSIVDICLSHSDYAFKTWPGRVSLIDLKKKAIHFFNTTYCAPAHFEINENKNLVYTSSHNFCRLWEDYYFLGSAAIDKFYFEGGKLYKTGTFTDQTAYRFTTHKIFDYDGKSYLCSFGQPNRFFLIDADTMRLVYYLDLGKDVLSDKNDIRSFLNNNKLESMSMRAFEVSQDGEILFVIGYSGIYFLDIFKQKIIGTIDYHPKITLAAGASLADFCNRTTHCDYLK